MSPLYSAWIENAPQISLYGPLSNRAIALRTNVALIVLSFGVLVHSIFIHGEKYNSIKISTDLGAFFGVISGFIFIATVNNPSPLNQAVLFELLYNGIFYAIIQVSDAYMFYTRFVAVAKVPSWKVALIHCYIWIVLVFSWILFYTILPFSYNCHTDEVTSLIYTIQTTGSIFYYIFFTIEFIRILLLVLGDWRHDGRNNEDVEAANPADPAAVVYDMDNNYYGGDNHTSDEAANHNSNSSSDHQNRNKASGHGQGRGALSKQFIRLVAVKSVLHCITSVIANHSAVPGTQFILWIGGMHIWFNMKIEEVYPVKILLSSIEQGWLRLLNLFFIVPAKNCPGATVTGTADENAEESPAPLESSNSSSDNNNVPSAVQPRLSLGPTPPPQIRLGTDVTGGTTSESLFDAKSTARSRQRNKGNCNSTRSMAALMMVYRKSSSSRSSTGRGRGEQHSEDDDRDGSDDDRAGADIECGSEGSSGNREHRSDDGKGAGVLMAPSPSSSSSSSSSYHHPHPKPTSVVDDPHRNGNGTAAAAACNSSRHILGDQKQQQQQQRQQLQSIVVHKHGGAATNPQLHKHGSVPAAASINIKQQQLAANSNITNPSKPNGYNSNPVWTNDFFDDDQKEQVDAQNDDAQQTICFHRPHSEASQMSDLTEDPDLNQQSSPSYEEGEREGDEERELRKEEHSHGATAAGASDGDRRTNEDNMRCIMTTRTAAGILPPPASTTEDRHVTAATNMTPNSSNTAGTTAATKQVQQKQQQQQQQRGREDHDGGRGAVEVSRRALLTTLRQRVFGVLKSTILDPLGAVAVGGGGGGGGGILNKQFVVRSSDIQSQRHSSETTMYNNNNMEPPIADASRHSPPVSSSSDSPVQFITSVTWRGSLTRAGAGAVEALEEVDSIEGDVAALTALRERRGLTPLPLEQRVAEVMNRRLEFRGVMASGSGSNSPMDAAWISPAAPSPSPYSAAAAAAAATPMSLLPSSVSIHTPSAPTTSAIADSRHSAIIGARHASTFSSPASTPTTIDKQPQGPGNQFLSSMMKIPSVTYSPHSSSPLAKVMITTSSEVPPVPPLLSSPTQLQYRDNDKGAAVAVAVTGEDRQPPPAPPPAPTSVLKKPNSSYNKDHHPAHALMMQPLPTPPSIYRFNPSKYSAFDVGRPSDQSRSYDMDLGNGNTNNKDEEDGVHSNNPNPSQHKLL